METQVEVDNNLNFADVNHGGFAVSDLDFNATSQVS